MLNVSYQGEAKAVIITLSLFSYFNWTMEISLICKKGVKDTKLHSHTPVTKAQVPSPLGCEGT